MEYILIVFGFLVLVRMIVAPNVSLKGKISPEHGKDNPINITLINRIEENEKKQMMLARLKRIIPLMEWRGVIKDGSFIRLYLSSKTTMTLNCRLYVESCEEIHLMSEYVTAQDDSNFVLDVLSSGNIEPINGKYYFGVNNHDIGIYRNDYNWSDAFSWFNSKIKHFVDTCQYKSIAIEYDGSIESPSIMIRFKT